MLSILAFATLACATPAFLQSPAQRVCTRLVDTCALEARDGDDPYAACVEDLTAFAVQGSAEEIQKLEQCVTEASGCGGVQGCLAGAGLKRVFNDIGGLFKGIGKMLESDD